MAPAATAARPPPVPRLGSTFTVVWGCAAVNASPICRMAASAIPVPPMRNGTGSTAATRRGDAIAIETAKAATPAKASRRGTDPRRDHLERIVGGIKHADCSRRRSDQF